MQDAEEEFIEAALDRVATLLHYTEITDRELLLDAIVSNLSISRSDAYLLLVAATLLNKYRESGSDIDKI